MPANSARAAWGMSDDDVTDFYMRWREWMQVSAKHGAILVASPKHQDFFVDMQERLLEDPWWKLLQLDPPPMLMKVEVPEDALLFWTEANGLQTPAEFIGPTGFGRLTAAAPSRHGVRPWSTAAFKGKPKMLRPDQPKED